MRSYSQFGEDLLLWRYFNAKTEGVFVEVGANHPTLCSQTYFFESRGWHGILVEPIPGNCELLRQTRPKSQVFQCALGRPDQRGTAQFYISSGGNDVSGLAVNSGVVVERVVNVEVRTLDEVLAEAGNPQIDFISIDVEGWELQVLEGFDLHRHRPAVLLVEDHLKQLSVHRHMARHGYRVVKRTGCNNWYIPRYGTFGLSTVLERMILFRKMYVSPWLRRTWKKLSRRKKD
ncbi:MAG: FkbM family methyltransferase [Verrucomicrobiota bacterium]|jgi:FkbM family methyltransferase